MNSTKLLLILSVLPSIVLGIMVYKKDIVEKEPKELLIKLLLGGLFSIVLTIIISFILDPILPDVDDYNKVSELYFLVYTFIKIALVEEFSKWIILKKLTWKNKEFNYIFDAIVYAVFISLGFATIENILYVTSDEGGFSVAILRALVSVPGHVFNGVFMGYYYGISKQAEINGNKNLMKKNMILSLLIPTILHFVFDYLLSSNNKFLLIIYLIFIILLYVSSFKKINQLSNITKSLDNKNNNYNTYSNRYCTNCGHKVYGNFCSNCGYKVE